MKTRKNRIGGKRGKHGKQRKKQTRRTKSKKGSSRWQFRPRARIHPVNSPPRSPPRSLKRAHLKLPDLKIPDDSKDIKAFQDSQARYHRLSHENRLYELRRAAIRR